MTGFKDFAAGDVLTAAQVDGYLMHQVTIICTSSTRPSSPVTGMRIYETDTDSDFKYSGSAWVPIPIWRYAYKTVDQAIALTTTLADVNDLSLTLSAPTGSKYLLEYAIHYAADAGGDLKYKFVGPAGSTFRYGHAGAYDVGGSFTANSYTEASTPVAGGVGAFTGILLRGSGLITMGASTGTFKYQHTQNTSSANGTTTYAGSWFGVARVA